MSRIKITNYAPVVIPTLNRYEHFKRCLESLEYCTGADRTDVYIGLDYPPSEKYVEGWKKIDAYLTEKERKNGFKNLFVLRRDHNCGVSGPGNNYDLLYQEVTSFSEAYIITEDDNVFSPNFLEYMNKGLEKYKDNDKIILISGYAYPDLINYPSEGNVIAFHKAAAWGCAFWVNKRFTHLVIGREKYRDSILYSWKKSFKLFRLRPYSLNSLVSMKLRNTTYGDSMMVDCMLLEDKYCVFPKLSKVRNWGHDGTGEHCSTTDLYINQPIDTEETFEYDELEYSQEMPYDYKVGNKFVNWMNMHFLHPFVVSTRYLFFRMTGRDLYFFRFHK